MIRLLALSRNISEQVIGEPLSDLPWYLVEAMTTVDQIVSWQSSGLPPDKMPPVEIWGHQRRLTEHFEWVQLEMTGQDPKSKWDRPPADGMEEFDNSDIWNELRAP